MIESFKLIKTCVQNNYMHIFIVKYELTITITYINLYYYCNYIQYSLIMITEKFKK
jgi:hypothetical protein